MPSPPSALEAAIGQFHGQVLSGETAARLKLTGVYQKLIPSLEQQINGLVAELDAADAAGIVLSPAKGWQLTRAQQLLEETQKTLTELAPAGHAAIVGSQSNAIALAQQHTAKLALVQASEAGQAITTGFAGLNAKAIEAQVAALQEGTPFATIFTTKLGDAAAETIRGAITHGLALGINPRQIGTDLSKKLAGLTEWKAQQWARDATITALHAGQLAFMRENADLIGGWRWRAARQPGRTCLSCLANDGKTFPLDRTLPRHSHCRCVMIPVLPGVKSELEDGRDWFDDLGDADKRAWGPGVYDLLQNQGLTLDDFVLREHSADWGWSYRQAPQYRARLNHAASVARQAAKGTLGPGAGSQAAQTAQEAFAAAEAAKLQALQNELFDAAAAGHITQAEEQALAAKMTAVGNAEDLVAEITAAIAKGKAGLELATKLAVFEGQLDNLLLAGKLTPAEFGPISSGLIKPGLVQADIDAAEAALQQTLAHKAFKSAGQIELNKLAASDLIGNQHYGQISKALQAGTLTDAQLQHVIGLAKAEHLTAKLALVADEISALPFELIDPAFAKELADAATGGNLTLTQAQGLLADAKAGLYAPKPVDVFGPIFDHKLAGGELDAKVHAKLMADLKSGKLDYQGAQAWVDEIDAGLHTTDAIVQAKWGAQLDKLVAQGKIDPDEAQHFLGQAAAGLDDATLQKTVKKWTAGHGPSAISKHFTPILDELHAKGLIDPATYYEATQGLQAGTIAKVKLNKIVKEAKLKGTIPTPQQLIQKHGADLAALQSAGTIPDHAYQELVDAISNGSATDAGLALAKQYAPLLSESVTWDLLGETGQATYLRHLAAGTLDESAFLGMIGGHLQGQLTTLKGLASQIDQAIAAGLMTDAEKTALIQGLIDDDHTVATNLKEAMLRGTLENLKAGGYLTDAQASKVYQGALPELLVPNPSKIDLVKAIKKASPGTPGPAVLNAFDDAAGWTAAGATAPAKAMHEATTELYQDLLKSQNVAHGEAVAINKQLNDILAQKGHIAAADIDAAVSNHTPYDLDADVVAAKNKAKAAIGQPVPAPKAPPAPTALPHVPANAAGTFPAPSGPPPLFPSDPSQVVKIKGLGGSTGAELVDYQGQKFVRKTGGNAGHLRSEAAADAAYRAMGIDVPEFHLYEGTTPVKLAKFVDGEVLANLTGQARADAEAVLRDHFVADALLGNWDVVGLSADNILVTKTGQVFRIDNGGALDYRAQGLKKKAGDFGTDVTDLDSLRLKNNAAGAIFKHVTDGDIYAQINAYVLPNRQAIEATIAAARPDLAGVMKGRLDYLAAWAKDHAAKHGIATAVSAAPAQAAKAVADYTEKHVDELVDELYPIGFTTPEQNALKASLKQTLAATGTITEADVQALVLKQYGTTSLTNYQTKVVQSAVKGLEAKKLTVATAAPVQAAADFTEAKIDALMIKVDQATKQSIGFTQGEIDKVAANLKTKLAAKGTIDLADVQQAIKDELGFTTNAPAITANIDQAIKDLKAQPKLPGPGVPNLAPGVTDAAELDSILADVYAHPAVTSYEADAIKAELKAKLLAKGVVTQTDYQQALSAHVPPIATKHQAQLDAIGAKFAKGAPPTKATAQAVTGATKLADLTDADWEAIAQEYAVANKITSPVSVVAASLKSGQLSINGGAGTVGDMIAHGSANLAVAVSKAHPGASVVAGIGSVSAAAPVAPALTIAQKFAQQKIAKTFALNLKNNGHLSWGEYQHVLNELDATIAAGGIQDSGDLLAAYTKATGRPPIPTIKGSATVQAKKLPATFGKTQVTVGSALPPPPSVPGNLSGQALLADQQSVIDYLKEAKYVDAATHQALVAGVQSGAIDAQGLQIELAKHPPVSKGGVALVQKYKGALTTTKYNAGSSAYYDFKNQIAAGTKSEQDIVDWVDKHGDVSALPAGAPQSASQKAAAAALQKLNAAPTQPSAIVGGSSYTPMPVPSGAPDIAYRRTYAPRTIPSPNLNADPFDHAGRAAEVKGYQQPNAIMSNYVEPQYKKWAQAVDPGSRAAFVDYTGNLYSRQNDWLRKGIRPRDPQYVEKATAAMERGYTLAEAGVPVDMKVYRGTGFTSGVRAPEIENAMPGHVLEMTGFDSYSITKSTSENFAMSKPAPVLFEVLAPKGTKAAYVKSVSQVSSENELLFPRGARFLVHEVRREKKGGKELLHIVAEAID